MANNVVEFVQKLGSSFALTTESGESSVATNAKPLKADMVTDTF